MDDNETRFGYRKVSKAEKKRLVGKVFSSVADRYDLMNDLMSCGLHRLWKRFLVWLCAARPGHCILDLAGGSGDLAARLHPQLRGEGRIVVADINAAMLERGRNRLLDQGKFRNLSFVQCDAEALPFKEHSFDRIVMGFGLRNVADKMSALRHARRVLKPGGCFLVLEFSRVNSWLEPLYDAWSFGVLPRLGRWVAKDEPSYRYLAESIRVHPSQRALIEMMQQADFEYCEYFNLSQGIVAIHRGYKI